MGEPIDATLEEFHALGQHLHAVGRFHEHRRSRLSGPFTVTSRHAAERVLVSAESVPFRPNRGVYVVVRDGSVLAGDASSTEALQRHGHVEDEPMAGSLLEVDGVAGVWTFATDRRFDTHGWRPGDKTITVCYLDAEPLAVTSRLSELVRAEAGETGRSVVFAGPLETITPWRWDWFDEGA
jgi:hypothetical protein